MACPLIRERGREGDYIPLKPLSHPTLALVLPLPLKCVPIGSGHSTFAKYECCLWMYGRMGIRGRGSAAQSEWEWEGHGTAHEVNGPWQFPFTQRTTRRHSPFREIDVHVLVRGSSWDTEAYHPCARQNAREVLGAPIISCHSRWYPSTRVQG